MKPSGPVRAVQYVRMSTDHQSASIAYQTAANEAYAKEHGYDIVRTYSDPGVSGLSLAGRNGLKRLLSSVVGGRADFSVVLVYDISRWGRFQDPDQAAHYEFLCREAGVRIEYTAEPHANDPGIPSALLKALKRLMAAEYSRELSERISRAQQVMRLQGYWMGGPAPFGLQRVMLTAAGAQIMRPGDQKGLRDARTLLVPGPPEEIAVVRRIFHLCAVERLGANAIAKILNAEGVPARPSPTWSGFAVRRVLVNQAFVGTLVFGRFTIRMGDKTRHPPASWARVPNAIPPTIPLEEFEQAQQRLRTVYQNRTDEEMLNALRLALERHGRLTTDIVKNTPECSSPASYHHRFGSLVRAYELIGYPFSRRQAQCAAQAKSNRLWLRDRYPQLSDDEMLARLAALYRKHGRLSIGLIDGAPDLPHSDVYRRRFEGLRRTYALVGYAPNALQDRYLDARRALSISREQAAELCAAVQRRDAAADAFRESPAQDQRGKDAK